MRRTHSLLAAGALAVLGTATALTGAYAQGGGTVAPTRILDSDAADPDVARVGDTYYLYATSTGGRRVPVRSAKSLTGPWSASRDAMPANAAWSTGRNYWAPEVRELGPQDFRLYFTAQDRASGRQCIGVASATSPTGPFVPADRPLQCDAAEGGAIDASTFRDDDGSLYLVYKNDGNAIRRPTSLWLQRLSGDGKRFVGERTRLLSNDSPQEHGIIEAPVLVKRGGRYVLLYSGGEYWNGTYFTSYATSTSLRGAYTKAFRPLMTNASLGQRVDGPGGQDVVSTPQGDRIVFHGWRNPEGHNGGRAGYVADLGFPDGYPVVRGSRVRYEAERAAVHGAQVRRGAAYSQGATVGMIDRPDSCVELSVWVPTAGSYTATVAYDAGYGAATHTVSVNGAPQGSISYANTGWGTVGEARVNVQLRAGANTLRLAKGQRWAQVDHVEIA